MIVKNTQKQGPTRPGSAIAPEVYSELENVHLCYRQFRIICSFGTTNPCQPKKIKTLASSSAVKTVTKVAFFFW